MKPLRLEVMAFGALMLSFMARDDKLGKLAMAAVRSLSTVAIPIFLVWAQYSRVEYNTGFGRFKNNLM